VTVWGAPSEASGKPLKKQLVGRAA